MSKIRPFFVLDPISLLKLQCTGDGVPTISLRGRVDKKYTFGNFHACFLFVKATSEMDNLLLRSKNRCLYFVLEQIIINHVYFQQVGGNATVNEETKRPLWDHVEWHSVLVLCTFSERPIIG